MNVGVSMMGRDAADFGVDVQPLSAVGWAGFAGGLITLASFSFVIVGNELGALSLLSIPSLIVSYGAAAIKKGKLRSLRADYSRAKPVHINVTPWVQGPTVGLGLRAGF